MQKHRTDKRKSQLHYSTVK
ncbi:hypothetical protein PK35_gp41 [Geobacillus phage vB_GthS_PK3.5]|nr:hypothetical protein PK35_gp41 [Geobacillus phage vB_GthS_PK3.5]